MSDVPNRPDPTGPAAGAAAPDAGPSESAAADTEHQDLAALVDRLEGQIANLTDRLLRAHAELDNVRKRAERDREETAKFAITRFARDVVTVADNFERAIQAVPGGAAERDPALKTLVEGVTMTEREFLNVLDRFGVKRVSPKGEAFNPHVHQAMMEMESPGAAPGTILEVFQPGYMIEDRVLRPAMVVVAKRSAKPAPHPAGDPGGSEPGNSAF